MTRFLAFGMSFLFVFALGISEADARRMGGGASSGTFSRQAAPTQSPAQASQPRQQQQPGAAAAAGTRSGFGGMLMGLAAGGLLAALFMGGAFEGIQFFDILLLLLIAGGVVMFLRSRAASRQPATEAAGSAYQRQSAATGFEGMNPVAPAQASADTSDPAIQYGAPSWFDEQGFIERARQHFMDLQAAWDANDLGRIREYVTPQLFKFLCDERARQPDEVRTEVRKLAAEVTNIQQIGDTVELAVMFHGVISETGSPDALFCEIWHLMRDMSQENAPWLIQGIEQVES
ncbi:Tim44 domain-containing protein [Marinospirillum alkaliphilum]|uniref:Predicted lipid-binding transport protein, Tim44 family n=1 Tax=Marinospirillum alkaliphilum DSM 21637 TaxID=1122209 RepID=A0A1K1VV41_9GAMM|nr:Tim44-like domain-containing protein [Marinospirillum alkaliphilum]SFX28998.1 Predicted lipid-binding transport protein, Tim44 family [Marinospirillum alkaliphilum DSM 21637]